MREPAVLLILATISLPAWRSLVDPLHRTCWSLLIESHTLTKLVLSNVIKKPVFFFYFLLLFSAGSSIFFFCSLGLPEFPKYIELQR